MILHNWQQWPNHTALESQSGSLTYAQLNDRVCEVADWLTQLAAERIALLADNSAEWIICDLACQRADKLLVPVPPYFSASQRQHLLAEAGIEFIITDQPALFDDGQVTTSPFTVLRAMVRENSSTPQIPAGTGKVTFTSGSTGNPKGVCLSNVSQARVAASIDSALNRLHVRHQCLLPLATLLENIAGVYAPLTCGGTVVVCGSDELGFSGARLSDPAAMLSAISKVQPESLILVPELLAMLVSACNNGWQPPESLAFIAVGGAHVPAAVMVSARRAGLPVYQGYGLSECVSVNTLNLPGADHPDSVGRSLGHNQLTIINGELVASGTIFLGYLNQPQSFYPTAVNTGDLVSEQDGYYYVAGRKKNLIITSLGRNISPEWVESLLLAGGLFSQVLVVGEARPHCAALLVPRHNAVSAEMIDHYMRAVNQKLPDYARLQVWHTLPEIAADAGLFTANGKLKRHQAVTHFQPLIETMYAPEVVSGEELLA